VFRFPALATFPSPKTKLTETTTRESLLFNISNSVEGILEAQDIVCPRQFCLKSGGPSLARPDHAKARIAAIIPASFRLANERGPRCLQLGGLPLAQRFSKSFKILWPHANGSAMRTVDIRNQKERNRKGDRQDE
jgi:hypothetical protein